MNLTSKQARFIEEYLLDLNATQAAIRAGYSAKTAYSIGQEILKKPEIQEAICQAQKDRSERTKIDQDWVIKRLAALADADIKRVATWDASGIALADSDELTWEDTYTISEVILEETIKETEGGQELIMKRQKRLKQADKKGPLELIGKHLGMFTDKLKISGDSTAPVQITYKKPE